MTDDLRDRVWRVILPWRSDPRRAAEAVVADIGPELERLRADADSLRNRVAALIATGNRLLERAERAEERLDGQAWDDLTAERDRLRAELERLREGQADDPGKPGTWPTPAQWIRRWNDNTPERRLQLTAGLVDAFQHASRCRREDHEGQIERLRAGLAEARQDWEVSYASYKDTFHELCKANERAGQAEAERDRLREDDRIAQEVIGDLNTRIVRAEKRAGRAEGAVDRFRARHQPKTITKITPCPKHQPYRPGVKDCPDCRTERVQVCSNITCCTWPCDDLLALDATTETEIR